MSGSPEGILVRFAVPSGCRNAFAVDHLSEFEFEVEILLPPYTPLKVTDALRARTGNRGFVICVEVLDGFTYERDYEEPTGHHSRAWPI
jgi:hypothetical protein